MSRCAVAAVSYLAECYPSGHRANSREIAENRNLSQALVAKILTVLSREKIVNGTPGPGGGYLLNVAPEKLSLADIVLIFEDPESTDMCPYGPDWCGSESPCPMHDMLVEMQESSVQKMRDTPFSIFIGNSAKI